MEYPLLPRLRGHPGSVGTRLVSARGSGRLQKAMLSGHYTTIADMDAMLLAQDLHKNKLSKVTNEEES